MMRPTWSFVYEDGLWMPHRTPEVSENLLRAVETLVVSFGRRSDGVRGFLEAWDELSTEPDYRVNTVAAVLRPAPDENVELVDKYGQFQNVEIPAAELRDALNTLAVTMDEQPETSTGLRFRPLP